MTPAERKHAAEVMASDGPWDSLSLLTKSPIWKRINGTPNWDWSSYKFRVCPKPIVGYQNMSRHSCSGLFHSRADADSCANDERIACVRVEFTEGQYDE